MEAHITKIDSERAARLATALRDNLKRRKAQARAASDPCFRENGDPETAPELPHPQEQE